MVRNYSPFDRALIGAQKLLARALPPVDGATAPHADVTPAPADGIAETAMDERARRHAAGLMRVNHAGEVAAQALYHGQALFAREPGLRAHLHHAADEERAHLQWCSERLEELGDRPSRLQPLWYAGSFAIGAAAGLVGDRVSLGFIAETEAQVAEHLDEHLDRLPAGDARSRAVIRRMRDDELRHGHDATRLGGVPLPTPVRGLMRRTAGVMKGLAYRF